MPFDGTNQSAQYAKDVEATPWLDFSQPANIDQDWEHFAHDVGEMSAGKWKSMAGGGFKGDAQIATASECALRGIISGFYQKTLRKTVWLNGAITLTDRDTHPGDESIEYSTAGFRDISEDDGVTARDLSPETTVTIAEDLTKQKYFKVATKVNVVWSAVQRANKKGQFSEFDRQGEALKVQHDWNINNLIRRGNSRHKIYGICNHPGIRRITAATDWGGSAPVDVYDEVNFGVELMISSATEEAVPQFLVLPAIQKLYFDVTQFSVATDSKLRQFIETAYREEVAQGFTPVAGPGLRVVSDPGMAAAGPFGDPAALFYTNDKNLNAVHMPLFRHMLPPRDIDTYTIQLEIITLIAGVQLFDVDTVLVVDGSDAGWQAPAGETFY